MIGRKPTLAEKENGAGRTVHVTLQLDPESRLLLRGIPQGFAGAFVRKALIEFLAVLDPSNPPRQIRNGEEIFALKAPANLLEKARAHVGRGKPYSTLSGLVRTAIHWKGRE